MWQRYFPDYGSLPPFTRDLRSEMDQVTSSSRPLSLSLSLQVVSHQFTPSPTRRRWLTRDLRPRMWSRRTLSWHQSAKQPKRRFEYPRQRRVTKLLYELTSCLQHICRLQPEMPSLCFLRPRIKRKILGCLLHYFTPLCIIQPHTVGNLLRHRNLDCNLK